MPDEIVLFAWVRDLDGDSELITGEDTDGIYALAGQWCMDRLRRDTPTIVTYLCRIGRLPLHLLIRDGPGAPGAARSVAGS